jgi:N-acetylglutamate synthase-like GNAT family acetyltransferase
MSPIRLAAVEDISKIVSLVESVYRGDSSTRGWTSEAHLLDGQRTDAAMIQEMLEESGSSIFVVDHDEKSLAACVHLKKENNFGYIGMVSVNTRLQNQGLGKRLLLFCEGQIKAWGLHKSKITVIPTRLELIAWYERFGYVKNGVEQPFPTDPRFGKPKVDGLKFVELEKTF